MAIGLVLAGMLTQAHAGNLLVPRSGAITQADGQVELATLGWVDPGGEATGLWASQVRGDVGIFNRLGVGGAVAVGLSDPSSYLAEGHVVLNVLDLDVFRLTPWGGAFHAAGPFEPTTGGAFGVAMEGGSEVVRADLSLSLAVWGSSASGTIVLGLASLALSEVGLSWYIDDHHTLRLGALAGIGHLDYRYRFDNGLVLGADIGLFRTDGVGVGGRLVAGYRF